MISTRPPESKDPTRFLLFFLLPKLELLERSRHIQPVEQFLSVEGLIDNL